MERTRRRELRDRNAKVWSGEKHLLDLSPCLDSSLKKNTAFIKRLRTGITSATLTSFGQDIRVLSLHKYVSEIVSACYEGICKLRTPSELAAGVEVVSLLHQRFGPADFTRDLGWLIGRGLAPPDRAHLKTLTVEVKEKEERERLSRQRVLLRLGTELWLVDVLRTVDDARRPDDVKPSRPKDDRSTKTIDGGPGHAKPAPLAGRVANRADDDAPFPLEVLKEILGQDREHSSLPLVNGFLKTYAWDLLGLKALGAHDRRPVDITTTISPSSGSAEEINRAEADAIDSAVVVVDDDDDDGPTTSPDLQRRFRNVFGQYLDGVKDHVINEQRALAAQARRNAEAYVKSGEIFEDRQANHDKRTKTYEKLVAEAQLLSQILGVAMPDLRVEQDPASTVNGGGGGVGLVNPTDYLRLQGDGAGIWEDEDERRFYENLVDLKDRVPAILLEPSKNKKETTTNVVVVVVVDEAVEKRPDTIGDGDDTDGRLHSIPDRPGSSSADDEKRDDEVDDRSMAITNKTVAAKVDALLTRLPHLTSKEAVDEVAIEFCFLNSKASRNRLGKVLQDIPRGRTDLLPLYARLLATLGRYLTDVVQRLISYLDAEFRSLQHRKDKDFLAPVRTVNVRYLAELTKFGMVPEHVGFHCLKVSLDDFSRVNIEIMCHYLESCGRYLLRHPDTSPRMRSFLETVRRKKTAQHLGQQERMLIENAIYYIDPPPRSAAIHQQRERTPVELYVRKLVYLEMNKRNYAKVLKQLRKLHWEEPEVVEILARIFVKPGKVKYGNIHLLAVLAGALYRYHQAFIIGVIDNLLERITLGLEHNDFKFNQRRISEVKYLGELYNYKMVDSPVIFDTLYRIVTFGHEGGTPRPDKYCHLDPPQDFFRVRLVCVLLETCGMCFDRGAAKKKLDFFLTFFQYYIHTKEPLPMGIDSLRQDTVALIRPQWRLPPTLEEATDQFAEAVLQNYKVQETDRGVEPEEMRVETTSEGEPDEDDSRLPELDEIQSSSEDNEASAPPETTELESEEEKIVVTRQEEERDPEAEAEFDRELAKLTAESLDSRKFDRKPMFDVPLPIKKNERSGNPTVLAKEAQPTTLSTLPDTMAFRLLTKRGNRQQTRTVEMPADSTFALALKTQQQAEREEQRRIKDLVLNYDLRVDDLDAADKTASSQQVKADRSRSNRTQTRARRLQTNDMDWY